jgi:hypothetical protein
MLAAHVLDNREGVTGLKFQAFVHEGVVYDEHLKGFLKAKKGKTANQILEEVGLDSLLLYNGMDALLEYEVARKQMKALKYPIPGE